MRKVSIVFGLMVAVLGSSYYYTQASSLSYHQSQYSANCNCTQPVRYVDPKQRYTSRGCCADMKRATRPFSDRIGTYRYRTPSSAKVARYGMDLSHPSRRHDVWFHSQYRKADPRLSVRQRKELTRRYQGYAGQNARVENNYPSDRYVIRNGDYKYKQGYQYNSFVSNGTLLAGSNNNVVAGNRTYAEYEKTGIPFAVDLQNTGVIQTGENTFEDKNSSLAFRIVRDNNCKGSFQQCVTTYSRAFKNGQNLSSTQGLYAKFQYGTTVEFDGRKYPVFTEGFVANGYGTNNVYYLYSMLDPSNGSIVRIEAVSLERDHGRAAKSVENVAQTFLFKPDGVQAVLLDE